MGSQRVGHDWATKLNWFTKASHDDYTWTEEVKIYSLPLDQGGMYRFNPSTLKEPAKSDCKEVYIEMRGLRGHFCSLPQKRAPAHSHRAVKSVIADCPPITVFETGTGVLLSQWNALNMFRALAAAAAKSLQSCLTLCDPETAAHQAPPSLGFSRQEYWNLGPLRRVYTLILDHHYMITLEI